MKSFILAFTTLCFLPSLVQADEFSQFGLANLQPISKAEGSKIRGAGRVASRSTGSAGLTATVLDPDSGSIWNFNVTQFNSTSDDKNNVYGNQYRSALSSTFSDLAVGFGDVGISLGEFNFEMIGAGARAAARTSAGSLARQIFQQ
ncbi:MAG: hypothetical protein VXZ38_06785 [Planctomycetota bacterium]|nr:hypothetical protein [Planctomycetota bacterium]